MDQFGDPARRKRKDEQLARDISLQMTKNQGDIDVQNLKNTGELDVNKYVFGDPTSAKSREEDRLKSTADMEEWLIRKFQIPRLEKGLEKDVPGSGKITTNPGRWEKPPRTVIGSPGSDPGEFEMPGPIGSTTAKPQPGFMEQLLTGLGVNPESVGGVVGGPFNLTSGRMGKESLPYDPQQFADMNEMFGPRKKKTATGLFGG